MADFLLKAQDIYKSYPQGSGELEILKGIDFEIAPAQAVAILGESGSGKSTLLHILGTLDKPNRGQLFFQDRDLLQLQDAELSQFRNQKMGFVFQFHHLLSEMNALENILIACRVGLQPMKESKEKAQQLLEMMGLKDRMRHYPNELSGGELQRVAIARALVRDPQILFADEPTGNLDSYNSGRIQELFFELQAKMGLALVIVTHDLHFATKFPKIMRMKDGHWGS